jgi:hypothetical protein
MISQFLKNSSSSQNKEYKPKLKKQSAPLQLQMPINTIYTSIIPYA